jgi:FADH2 O2-dependent halogenase
VSVALNSARFAARSILPALEKPAFGARDFEDYAHILTRGTQTWHRFISVYYRLHVVFTWFIRHPRHRPEVLRLLQGDVYDDSELPVLAGMEAMADAVAANPSHPLHGALGDLTSQAFSPDGWEAGPR